MFQDAICIFVNDNAKAEVISKLAECGIRLILLRCAGFNNVDIAAANDSKMKVMRVPRYSPNAVAEHAVALMMMLTRQTTFPFNQLITPEICIKHIFASKIMISGKKCYTCCHTDPV